MGKNVYANGMEISAKAADNQSIAAMPDVCLSPPSPPAGPVPLPYPNFSQASDTSNGTSTVKIGGQEAGQKDKSYYKTSKGDEAATRGLGMGTVTHTIQGKTYFAAWSMDVKLEGENAPRFMDLTTHNHMSPPPNSGCVTSSVAAMTMEEIREKCDELEEENQKDRGMSDPHGSGGTNANGYANTSEGTGSIAGHSWAGADSKSDKHVAGHPDRKPRSEGGTDSNVSCGNFSYRGPEAQCSGHAESRIIEHLFEGSGGTVSGQLTLKIDWKSKNSAAPCSSCHALMCAATQCGLQIFVCDKKGEPQEVKDCPKNLDMSDKSVRDNMAQQNKVFAASLNGTA
jgi:Toxin PAAR-like domain